MIGEFFFHKFERDKYKILPGKGRLDHLHMLAQTTNMNIQNILSYEP